MRPQELTNGKNDDHLHHKPAPKKGPAKRAFVEVAAVIYRKVYLERHITPEHHQESIRLQASLLSGISVMDSFELTVVLEHEAVIGGFIKHELAHHTNYSKLLSLAELSGCDYFRKLKIDQRNKYTSHRIIDDMLEILAEVIEEPILGDIKSSQAISLEANETTDVYLDKEGNVFNQFLDLVTVPDGKADTIVTAIENIILKKDIPTEKLYGLGTDGAAVMTGRVNGVVKQQFSKDCGCGSCCLQGLIK
ncbi:hypothetical protein G5714_004349 [Onychostoma macrolepis]|uniref:DUF4371 domain-containing protein n=1 Tax=Onychostoma macrolepis TaxID=369639 RepID=A0A7J6D4H0_9TELE|nr:hypothetical protein G5714_004349 [Onychostoma macrolepis]